MIKPSDENRELTMDELDTVNGAKFEEKGVRRPPPPPENNPEVTLVNNLMNALGNQGNDIAKNIGS